MDRSHQADRWAVGPPARTEKTGGVTQLRGGIGRTAVRSTATRPMSTCRVDGEEVGSTARFIAGCDGFHGVSRRFRCPRMRSAPSRKVYPFGWLGILADVPPCQPRADLCQPFARIRPVLHALEKPQRLLHPVQRRRQHRGVVRRSVLTELRRRLPPDIAETMITGPSLEKSIRTAEILRRRARCASATCSWWATRRISFLPPAPRGSTWRPSDVHYPVRRPAWPLSS